MCIKKKSQVFVINNNQLNKKIKLHSNTIFRYYDDLR